MSGPDHNSDLLLWDLQQWGNCTLDYPCGQLLKPMPPLSNSNSTASPPEFHGSPAPEKVFPKQAGSEVRSKESTLKRKGTKPPVSGSEHEVHIFTERERRKKMRSMFSNLHALLPHLPPKVDKSTIVDEAVAYIKQLQKTLQGLEKKKQEMGREVFLADQVSCSTYQNGRGAMRFPQFPCSFQTWTSPNVVLNICGEDAQIGICTTWKPGLLPSILYIFEKHKLEVMSAHISSDNLKCMYMFHTHVS
ncbi:unnamed protein product [Victoria cruziana]